MSGVAMSTFAAHNIVGGHKDLIHDVAFDWYGDRMATCSSDQHVKIWDRDPATNSWKNTATWKSHSGSVWKVTWAHPEFGQIVATCSFDRTAVIWEEVSKTATVSSMTTALSPGQEVRTGFF